MLIVTIESLQNCLNVLKIVAIELVINEGSLSNHDIIPVWMYSQQVWGEYDEALGKWTGAVGKVIEGKHSIFYTIV